MVESDAIQHIQFGDGIVPAKSAGDTANSTGNIGPYSSEKADYDLEDRAAQIATADLNQKVCPLSSLFKTIWRAVRLDLLSKRASPFVYHLQIILFFLEETMLTLRSRIEKAGTFPLNQHLNHRLSHSCLACLPFCRSLGSNCWQTYTGWMLMWLAYQSTGAIYGDIGTSPLVCITGLFSQAILIPKSQ
jgi:hypothetical protein